MTLFYNYILTKLCIHNFLKYIKNSLFSYIHYLVVSTSSKIFVSAVLGSLIYYTILKEIKLKNVQYKLLLHFNFIKSIIFRLCLSRLNFQNDLWIISISGINIFILFNSPEKKGDGETAESGIETIEGDVQGNVQIKMVVSNGKVCVLHNIHRYVLFLKFC